MRPVVSGQNPLRNPLNVLLGTEAHVRLLRVLADETDGPLTAPDAARRSGLTIRGTRKALNRLLKSGMVVRVGGGRKHQYELRRSDELVKALQKLFQSEKDRYEDLLGVINEGMEKVVPYPSSAWIQEFPAEFVDAMISFDGIYGIKFTDLDLARMQSMKQLAKGQFHIYGGVDVMALPMFCMGADGLIGSNYGALPEPWVAIYNTFQSGDLRKALKMQDRIGYYVRSFKHLWGAQRAKILLKVRGIDVGDAWLPKGPSTAEDFALCRKLWDELVTDPVFEGHIRQ